MPVQNSLEIVVADDDPLTLHLVDSIFSGEGHRIRLAESGESALEMCSERMPDVLIMDRMMPGLGGLQAIRRIRALPADVRLPIILMSAAMDEADILDAYEAGADEFILKPINPLHLTMRLRSVRRVLDAQRATMGVVNTLLDGVIRIDSVGRINMFNPAAESMFGYRAVEVMGQNVSLLMPEPDHGHHDQYLAAYHATGIGRIIGKGRKVKGRRKDGSVFPLHLGITRVDSTEGLNFIGLLRDLSQEEAFKEQIEHLALHDSLTGLPNRASCLEHAMDRYRDRTKPLPFSLFFCDLDGFKPVNDQLGHAAGDWVLIEVAKRFRQAMFLRDFVGRLGGDEFLVAVDGEHSDDEAFGIATRLAEALSPPIECVIGEFQVGVSIGYAHSRNYLDSPESLVSAADGAMYRAKKRGRGRICGA